MTEQEKIHYLSVLVELNLFPITRALKESNIENKDTELEKIIEKFTQDLPQYLSKIPDVDKKVRTILVKTEKNHEELKKLQEKHDKERDLREES